MRRIAGQSKGSAAPVAQHRLGDPGCNRAHRAHARCPSWIVSGANRRKGARAPFRARITTRPPHRARAAAATEGTLTAPNPSSADRHSGNRSARWISVSQPLGRSRARAGGDPDRQAASLPGSPPRGPDRAPPSVARREERRVWPAHDRKLCARRSAGNRARSASTTPISHPGHRGVGSCQSGVIALPLHAPSAQPPAPARPDTATAVPTPQPSSSTLSPAFAGQAAARKTGSVAAR